MRNLILILITISSLNISQAQEWKEIFKTEEATYYMRDHTNTSAWFKIEYIKEVKGKSLRTFGALIKSELYLFKFDCRAKKMGVMAYVAYDKNKEVLENKDIKDVVVEMEHIVPDSISEDFSREFCKSKK